MIFFDSSHLGKKEDVADLRQVHIWAEDMLGLNEVRKLLFQNVKERGELIRI